MNDLSSPYYPQRRRRFSGLLRGLARLVRMLKVESVALPEGASLLGLLLCLVLPGHVFVLSGWRRLGRGIQIGYAAGVLVFFAALGHAAANVAFGLLVSAHATSIIHLLVWWAGSPGLVFRAVTGLTVLSGLSLAVYFPARDWMLEHWFVPLDTRDRIIVVNRTWNPQSIRRNDTIAYHIEYNGAQTVSIAGGYGLDEVIARPGDVVCITPRLVFVNGQARLREPNMPREAAFTLAEKQWFVWPRLGIRNTNRAITDAAIAAAWLRAGMIDEKQIIGRPFRHWFGRSQLDP